MSSAPYVTHQHPPDTGNKQAVLGLVALLLGLLVAIVGFFALMMWLDARNARDGSRQSTPPATTTAGAMAGMASSSAALGSLTSYAAAAPANADELAAAH